MRPWQQQQIKRLVRAGGIIAYPTEAVYGLGCDPYNPQAVYRLLALKNRNIDKGLILIASHFEQLQPFLAPIGAEHMTQLMQSWPGPTTWLLPANPDTPYWLTGAHSTIATRITAHPVARKICETLGHAVISTSANRHGRAPAKSSLKVRLYFANGIDIIISSDHHTQRNPTEIRELTSGKILRKSTN